MTVRKKAKKKSKVKNKPSVGYRSAKDLPASFGALDKVRKELKTDITSVRLEVQSVRNEMQSGFKRIDARFSVIDARFNKIDGLFSAVNGRFNQLDAKFEQMNATNQRMLALLEEQNSRNKASYEGAEYVRVQQEKIIKRDEKLEDFQHTISKQLKSN